MNDVPHYSDDDEIGPHHYDALWAELNAAQRAAIGSGKRKEQMMTLYWFYPNGLIDWEMTHLLSRLRGRAVSHDSVKAMRHTLMSQGWVVRTGEHRMGPYGVPGEIFKAIPPGTSPVPPVVPLRSKGKQVEACTADEASIRELLRELALKEPRADYGMFVDRLVVALANPASKLRRGLEGT